jgi:dihydroorotate dehydrogenase electron transfer subunit
MWIHRVKPTGGYGATIELVVEPVGPGTHWLATQPTGAKVDITGPLGRPFALPKEPVSCVLVGEGYAAAPMFPLAERLRERDCAVTLVVAAHDEAHLLSALEARRSARAVTVVTGDGSIGSRGSVADVLPEVLTKAGAEVVYAAGPLPTLHAVASAAEQAGAWSQTAVEQPMACGTGLCQGCAVPVVGEDGVARMVRACVDGPVFRGDRVRWDDVDPGVRIGSA